MFQHIRKGMVIACLIMLSVMFTACGAVEQSSSKVNNHDAASNAIQSSPDTSETTHPEPTTSPTDVAHAELVELTISAAASLTDALREIETAFEAANPHIELHFNFGGSGALQQQIEQGAPSDLFLSAAVKNMKALVDQQLIVVGDQLNLLTNELVVIVPSDSTTEISSLADLTKAQLLHIAIGIPESVPAGSYAKEALISAGLWDTMLSKTVQAKDVRQVLQYVETGNADAGFVYQTDVRTSEQVKVAFTVDPTYYTPVQYPIGIVKATKHRAEAESFYAFLQSRSALDLFVKHGFTISNGYSL